MTRMADTFDPNQIIAMERADGTEQPIVSWNSTETYARVNGRWQIVHSHWSFVKPDLNQRISEES